jgi:tetratricopeptide (TPR) repeat protein
LLLAEARRATAKITEGEGLSPAEAALQHIEKACSEEPDTPECHAWRGKALHGLGRSADAIEALELALRLDPKNEALLALLQEISAPPAKPKPGFAASLRAFFTKK